MNISTELTPTMIVDQAIADVLAVTQHRWPKAASVRLHMEIVQQLSDRYDYSARSDHDRQQVLYPPLPKSIDWMITAVVRRNRLHGEVRLSTDVANKLKDIIRLRLREHFTFTRKAR